MIYAKPATSLLVVFRAFLASDHVTPATGKTIAITISKNGGAFGNPNAGATNATEISSGYYKVTLDTTDTGTNGPLAVRGAVATIDDVGVIYQVGLAPSDAVNLGGTAQTGRDIGASVLLSAGTGTGQLDFTSGVVKSNLAQILGTALTETAGLLAGGFKKFFNVASPTMTALGVDQTGDSYARVGAAGAGLTALGDTRIANLDATVSSRLATSGYTTPPTASVIGQAVWDALTSALTTANSIGKRLVDLFAGISVLAQWLGLLGGKQTGNSTARTEMRATGGGSGTFDETTDSQEALRDRGDAAWITATGFATSGQGTAIQAKTDNLPSDPADASDIATAFAAVPAAVWAAGTRTLTSFGTLVADVATAVWGAATRILTAGTNIVLAKGTGVTGFNDLSAAQVNAEADTAISDAALATASALAAVQTAILAALPRAIRKNTALAGFPFLMVLASDHLTPATGLTITATRSLGGAAFGACANAVSEIGSGWYKIDLAAADLNGDTVALKFSAATADTRNIAFPTQP